MTDLQVTEFFLEAVGDEMLDICAPQKTMFLGSPCAHTAPERRSCMQSAIVHTLPFLGECLVRHQELLR
jgi:hypothetical protein